MEATRTVLITGGSAGIGGHLTQRLAQLGWRVWFVGRNLARGLALEQRLTQAGFQARFLQADLSSQAGVLALAQAVRRALAAQGGRLEALVNNLGGVFTQRQLTPDGVEATMAYNFLHPLLLTCALLPELERAGGRVIHTSTGYHHLVRLRVRDGTGRRWDSGMNVYGRAKLLSVQVGEVLGQRWQARGIGVHFADPGLAETPLTRAMSRLDFPWYGRFLVPLIRQVQHRIGLDWCVTSALYLLNRPVLAQPWGLYILPGPWVLPRLLVGYNRTQGQQGLALAQRWLTPEARAWVTPALTLGS